MHRIDGVIVLFLVFVFGGEEVAFALVIFYLPDQTKQVNSLVDKAGRAYI